MKYTNSLVTSSKGFAMPTSLCTPIMSAHRGAAWTGAFPELVGEASVMTVADRKRTAVLATDQLVEGSSAWSPPT